MLVQIWKCIPILGEISYFTSSQYQCQNWETLMWIFWLLVPAICICVAIAFAWINEVTGGKQPWWPQHNLSITIRHYICRDQWPASSQCMLLSAISDSVSHENWMFSGWLGISNSWQCTMSQCVSSSDKNSNLATVF